MAKHLTRRHCIGLTMGDPSGIGPEICLKAMQALSATIDQPNGPCIRLYGDPLWLAKTAAQFGLPYPSEHIRATSHDGDYRVGEARAESGEAAYQAIAQAAQDCLTGQLDAMVTAPIHKGALHLAGHDWPGHTELLADLSRPDSPPPVRMMLATPDLRVVLHTIHVSLRDAIDQLTIDGLVETMQIAATAGPWLGLAQPRIALAALNPHASEGGKFGDEEQRLLSPAVARAQALGLNVSGPWSADTVFMRALGERADQRDFDLVVCLYHDQGLIPIKLRGIDQGVNITLGLPFVRTSVDHGTAFDRAGRGSADHRSLLAAIQQAQALLTCQES